MTSPTDRGRSNALRTARVCGPHTKTLESTRTSTAPLVRSVRLIPGARRRIVSLLSPDMPRPCRRSLRRRRRRVRGRGGLFGRRLLLFFLAGRALVAVALLGLLERDLLLHGPVA